jgi:hypothetical protein
MPKAPPLGIMPRDVWLEKRREALGDATARYIDAKVDIPLSWMKEFNWLNKEIRKERGNE